jgi:hypothetical protein
MEQSFSGVGHKWGVGLAPAALPKCSLAALPNDREKQSHSSSHTLFFPLPTTLRAVSDFSRLYFTNLSEQEKQLGR